MDSPRGSSNITQRDIEFLAGRKFVRSRCTALEKIGKYQILEQLGKGGMGVVYKALDTLIERVVAVKMVAANLDDDPELRARFFREARAAGQLSHKNIVTIFDLGEDNGRAYIAMEFLEGRDLRSELSKGNPMSLQDKLRIVKELCEGLSHAHEKGVIHRDIKPANVFITKSGHVKILDFGLARTTASDLTTSGHAMGTPNYMSPEQVRGEKVDHRTDTFSVGVLFYELLTRKKAFQGDSFTSTIYKILQDDPEPIETFDPSISPELCAIVYKALAKDREKRYLTLDELLRNLNSLFQPFEFELPPPAEDSDSSPPSGGRARQIAAPGEGRNVDSLKRAAPGYGSGKNVSSPRVATSANPPLKPSDLQPVGASDDLREEATQIEALPERHPARGFRRYIPAGFAVLVAVAFLTWAVAHYRVGGAGHSGDHPSTTPTSVSAQQVPVARPPSTVESQVHASPDTGAAGALARASDDLAAHKYSEAMEEAQSVLKSSPDDAKAQSILSTAAQSLERVKTGIRDAKSQMAAGEYERAGITLRQVLALAPTDAEALGLAGQLSEIARKSAELGRKQLVEMARKNAEQARAQLADSKSKAGDARGSQAASKSLEAAAAAESEADHLYGQARFEEAAAKYAAASDLLTRARNEASAERAANAEQARRTEVERQQALMRTRSDASRQAYERERDLAIQAGAPSKVREQFGEAEKIALGARAKADGGDFEGAAREYDSATASIRRAHNLALEAAPKEALKPADTPNPPTVSAPPGQPAPDSHETLEATQKEISDIPEKYRAAMEGKDSDLLRNIWPTLTPQQEQAYKEQWAYTRSLRITPRQSKIEKLEGDTAIVSVLLHYEQVMNRGANMKWDQKATFALVRKGRSWFIESASFQALR